MWTHALRMLVLGTFTAERKGGWSRVGRWWRLWVYGARCLLTWPEVAYSLAAGLVEAEKGVSE